MRTTLAFVRRNLTIYFRDRAGVFLSLLSAVILLLLYTLFLGSLQIDSIKESLPAASDDDIHAFVNCWVLAGIVMITTFTTSFGAMGVFVDDRVFGRFKDFRVAPMRRFQLILGYQGAAFIVSSLMSLVIMVIGVALLMAVHSVDVISWPGLALAAGYVLLLSAAFSAVSSFVLTFVRSSNAYTAVSTIVGTLLGFLAGAYLPVGLLSSTVRDVINALPFSPAAMLLREPLAGRARDTLAGGVSQAATSLDSYYGFTLSVSSFDIGTLFTVVALIVVLILFTTLGALRIGRVLR
ncbi:ABC transporter permease [Acidipropionibacterium virtanenii]|uniref:ABC-2 type transporter transmembrane domain-containing protein n=1 Tax=Acidipropionibacterium virtanenii TaxID=2057246 RepID=A0A344UQ66_9ACTN|nr:ABC transporter permease [Acidipropionibacterium virtanenii]AXE37414.1 hypothetical protein JS278_00217 [Acidipropionibacterium virtanenii]